MMPWVKAGLLLCAAVFMAVILLRHWLRTSPGLARVLAVVAGVGLLAGSAAEVYFTLQSVVGFVDSDLYWNYVTATRHGEAVIWRAGLTVALVILSLLPVRTWQAFLLLPGWLALLASFSYTSHAAAMGGSFEFTVDLVHFTAAGVWTGVILALVFARALWQPGAEWQLSRAMRVVSTTGLLSVLVVAGTGVVSTLFHTSDPDMFVGSPYSIAWLVKIGLVVLTVGVAALNRFVFMPQLESGRGSAGLRRNLLLEALLLVAVFAATGVLSTSELPHGPEIYGPAQNLQLMFNHFFGQ